MAQLTSGDVIDGRFEVEFLAGAGGMGRVYRCMDTATGLPVALKLIDAAATGASRERFAREVRLLSELHHPGIVRYVAHGLLSDSEPYLIMEWVEGEALAGRVCGEPLSVRDAVMLGARLCDALGEAHARGIVHRDIKPTNIFLEGGQLAAPKLLDFGLARAIDAAQPITKTGTMIGTPAYMAPEQARKGNDLDARADVFALGCVLFECLTGFPAFRGPNVVSVLCKVLLEDPPWLHDVRSDVPGRLANLIARMLAKNVSERPSDARAVGEALARFSGLEGEQAGRASQRPTIGSDEQRYLSVILAGRPQENTLTELPTAAGTPRLRISRALSPFDAEINQLADSTVMITLRGKGTAADRATTAARCALAVRDMLPQLPVVLATGRGLVRVRQPVGEVIDEAVRLLQVAARAAPNETDGGLVLVDPMSANLLEPCFDLRRGEDRVELLSYRSQAAEPRKLLGRKTPCVGRARELATLRAVWEECLEERVARPVLITGPAGIGKTRLIREWMAELKAGEALVLAVRADPMASGGIFGVLSRLLASAAGVGDDDDRESVQQKLRKRVEAHVPAADVARVSEFLAEMLGAPYSDADSLPQRAARHDSLLRGDQIRRAFLDWLAAEARAQPVLVVLDDLQWADLPSVELLTQGLSALREYALCLVGLARPEVEARFPRLWSERDVTTFSVGPLRLRAAVQLVCAVREGVSDAHAEALAVRSGGNPFFLEELIRADAEGRATRAPDTVLAMLHARLDDFSPVLRLVLRAGSIFGDTFSADALSELLGTETGEVTRHLEALLAREVLVRVASSARTDEWSRSAAETNFGFVQGLWREAAYATLTERDRRLGHALAAAWLEGKRPGEALAIAEHYELGNQPDRAAKWFVAAARQALEGGDHRAALARAERGIACGLADNLGELRCIQAEAYKWCGENVLAERFALEAMERLAPGQLTWYAAAGEAVAAAGKLGHVERLIALAEALKAGVLQELDAEPARVIALTRAATQLVLAGQNEQADALLSLFADGEADAAVVGFLYEARAVRAGAANDPARRVLMAQRAAACFTESGDLRNASLQLGSVGFALNEIGAYAEAERALREAIALAERMALANAASTAQAQLGRALARLGRWAESEAVLRTAIEALHAQGNPRLEGVARSYLAWLLGETGRVAEGEREAQRAVLVLAAAPQLAASARATLALLLLRSGHLKAALQSAREAHATLEQAGTLSTGEGLVRLAWLECLLASGMRQEAFEAAAQAHAYLAARASHIRHTAWREALYGVREHTRIGALCSQLLGG